MAVEYREPWYEIEDKDHRAALQRQYDLEISKQHLLWEEEGFVIGKNRGTDDVLVQLADGRFAIVHLVWTTGPGDATWPEATLYPSASEVSHAIAADAEDFDP